MTTGPPTVKPYCWKVVSGLGRSSCLAKKSFPVRDASCRKAKALPWKALVPCLVMAFTTAPVVRPNSASNWLVRTWNSCTASIGIRAWGPAHWPEMSSLLLPPSSMKLLLRGSCPLATTESSANEPAPVIGTMPGSRATKPMKLRLRLGRSVSSPLVMWPPTSLEVTSTMDVSAVTVSSSSGPPTSRAMSTVAVFPTSRRTPRRVYLLNPVRSAESS